MITDGASLGLAAPLVLLALVVPLLLLWWRLRRARHGRLLFSDLRLVSGLTAGWRTRLRHLPLILRVVGLAVLVLALARPQAESRSQEILSEGVDILIALDNSGSMAAIDLGKKPGGFDPISRLDFAQKVVADFVRGRQADRIGIVVFAGKAFTRCPLTSDYGLLLELLDSVEIARRYDGTAIGMGLATAVNRLKDSPAKSRVVVLLTDGRNNTGEIDPVTAARLAEAMNVKVHTIGVGTEGAAPVPVDDPVFGRRYVFQPVDLDEKTLREIAQETNGRYFRATDAQTLKEIFQRIDEMEKTEVKVKERVQRRELFLPLVVVASLLLLLESLLGLERSEDGALMRFANPGMLLWWAALPLLAVLIGFGIARARNIMGRLGEASTLRRLADSASLERRVIKGALLLAGGFFLVVTLARPQWGRIAEPVTRKGVDVIIALDVSASMLAEDVTPNRLSRAKAFTADLARRLEGNRIGIVAFAGSAFVQCPLTLDLSAVNLFLDIMDVGDVPDPGSNLAEAIQVAAQAFPDSSAARRVLVIVSDGEGHEEGEQQAAQQAAEKGILVYTVGTGTPAGGPIPLRNDGGEVGGYKKNSAGRVVTTRLEPDRLVALAEAGEGRFLMATSALSQAKGLADEIDRMEKADLSSRIITTYRDRFQLALALSLLFLTVEAFLSPARRTAEES